MLISIFFAYLVYDDKPLLLEHHRSHTPYQAKRLHARNDLHVNMKYINCDRNFSSLLDPKPHIDLIALLWHYGVLCTHTHIIVEMNTNLIRNIMQIEPFRKRRGEEKNCIHTKTTFL